MPSSQRRMAVSLAAAMFMAIVVASCGGAPPPRHPAAEPDSRARASGPTSTTTIPTTQTPVPLALPVQGAYLGAWVRPVHDEGHGVQAELAQLPAFTGQVGRPMALLHVYRGFGAPVPVAALDAVHATGAVPLLDWGCASVASINAGHFDTTIRRYATQLRAYGQPVLLRWFWEMNLRDAKTRNCLGAQGAPGFVAAWKRIWNLFHAVGADNVSFVWCPGISAGLASMAPYFPGSSYVDWIGIDGYDRKGVGAAAFSTLFGGWYGTYAASGKPLMIGETGSLPDSQASFLAGVQQQLPTEFPKVRAFVYFDAPGPAGDWSLSPGGLSAFGELAADPYFSAMPATHSP